MTPSEKPVDSTRVSGNTRSILQVSSVKVEAGFPTDSSSTSHTQPVLKSEIISSSDQFKEGVIFPTVSHVHVNLFQAGYSPPEWFDRTSMAFSAESILLNDRKTPKFLGSQQTANGLGGNKKITHFF